MTTRVSLFWRAFIRSFIVILALLLIFILVLVFNSGMLRAFAQWIGVPNIVEIPPLDPTLPPPIILAPPGKLPGGTVSFEGNASGTSFACGFLLELDDGRKIGVSTAHASPVLAPQVGAVFSSPDHDVLAPLLSQIAHGKAFTSDDFTVDYALWSVSKTVDPVLFLKPDPRGQGQPGELVQVYSPFDRNSYQGVVSKVTDQATWIQLSDSFNPVGFSGCPVISRYTGKVLGMAVAGANKPPVVMGLHPISSIVAKAAAALSAP
jgi:hypothetical protein